MPLMFITMSAASHTAREIGVESQTLDGITVRGQCLHRKHRHKSQRRKPGAARFDHVRGVTPRNGFRHGTAASIAQADEKYFLPAGFFLWSSVALRDSSRGRLYGRQFSFAAFRFSRFWFRAIRLAGIMAGFRDKFQKIFVHRSVRSQLRMKSSSQQSSLLHDCRFSRMFSQNFNPRPGALDDRPANENHLQRFILQRRLGRKNIARNLPPVAIAQNRHVQQSQRFLLRILHVGSQQISPPHTSQTPRVHRPQIS